MVSDRTGSQGDPSLRFLSILLFIAGSIAASTIYLAYAGLPPLEVLEDGNIQSSPAEIQSIPETNEESSHVTQPKQELEIKTRFTEYIDRLLEKEN